MICITSAFTVFIFDAGFDLLLVLQALCFAFATVLLIGVKANERLRPAVVALKIFLTACVFIVLNIGTAGFSKLTKVFFGSYLHYFIGMTLYAVFFGKHDISTRAVMTSVVFSISVTMATFGTILGNAIEINVDGFDIAWTKAASSVLVVVIAFIYFRYPLFAYRINRFDATLNITSNILSALLFVILELWRAGSMDNNRFVFVFSGYMAILIIFVFAINVMTYFMTYFLCRERERTLNYQIERQRIRSMEALVSLNEEKLSQLREVRHDVKNQYSYMQTLLEENRYDELKAYFNELVGTFSRPLYDSVESGNRVIDSVLNMELSKARDTGLKMNVRVAVPSELPFPPSALMSLFGNIIDNAIEACVRENLGGSTIDIVVSLKGDYLFFVVSNPTNKKQENIGDSPKTDKEDKTRHGYGIRIVKKIVKKYGGHCHYYIENGNFVVECLLDLRYDKNDKEI